MKLENEFRVEASIDEAWAVLTDIPLIAPCLPGAQLTGEDGDEYSGRVKIKVGPVTSEYSGTAVFVERNEETHHVEIAAKGRDSRGSGNASATITADMVEDGDGTKVTINTDLKIAGKVAQFGKGMIAEVSGKLIDQFAACIEQHLSNDTTSADQDADGAATASNGSDSPAATKAASAEPAEALDLMELAGNSIYKRLIPIAAVVVTVVLIKLLLRRK